MIVAMIVWKLIIIMAAVITDVSTQDRVGCFVDAWDRVLESRRDIPSMTVESCLNACFSDHYVFAGVEAGGQCFCGNSTDHTKNGAQADDSDCNRNCNGDMSQICGGSWRIEIYTDHDECSDGNNGGCNQNCVNDIGSYHCTCHEGYELNDGENLICTDIDECHLGITQCNHICNNTQGSFYCSCWHGYELVGTEFVNCTDRDECTEENNGGCNHICENNLGSFHCTCHNGYELKNGEQLQCTDIDECSIEIDKCNQNCINTEGGYNCSCSPGYEPMGEAMNICTDIDECSKGSHQCSQICINTPGQYKCDCEEGYHFRNSNIYTCSDDEYSDVLEQNARQRKIITGLIAALVVTCLAMIICIVLLLIVRFRQQRRTSIQTGSRADNLSIDISTYEHATDNMPPKESPNYDELQECRPIDPIYETITPEETL